MPGPAPKLNRRRRNAPARGDWTSETATGWQHGETPQPPRVSIAARETWTVWMGSWFAAHWLPEDLPNLRLVIKLWAKAWTGKAASAERSELRQLMDSYGITRKGQQDRHWVPPDDLDAPGDEAEDGGPVDEAGPYGHLRVVADGA
jgi:hypothetical protein